MERSLPHNYYTCSRGNHGSLQKKLNTLHGQMVSIRLQHPDIKHRLHTSRRPAKLNLQIQFTVKSLADSSHVFQPQRNQCNSVHQTVRQ